jgi:hypothetical protein
MSGNHSGALFFGSDNRNDLLYNAYCVTSLLAEMAPRIADDPWLSDDATHGLSMVLTTVANTINLAIEGG